MNQGMPAGFVQRKFVNQTFCIISTISEFTHKQDYFNIGAQFVYLNSNSSKC